MKKNMNLLWIVVVVVSCTTMKNNEKTILEYMRDQTGSPKLEIEFSEVESIRYTVGDSIRILQEIYEKNVKEREEKMTSYEKVITDTEAALKSFEKRTMEHQIYSQMLENAIRQHKEWKERVVENDKVRYDGRDTNELIAVLVNCRMTSLINPVLNAKQTKEGTFLLSPDEKQCFRQLK